MYRFGFPVSGSHPCWFDQSLERHSLVFYRSNITIAFCFRHDASCNLQCILMLISSSYLRNILFTGGAQLGMENMLFVWNTFVSFHDPYSVKNNGPCVAGFLQLRLQYGSSCMWRISADYGSFPGLTWQSVAAKFTGASAFAFAVFKVKLAPGHHVVLSLQMFWVRVRATNVLGPMVSVWCLRLTSRVTKVVASNGSSAEHFKKFVEWQNVASEVWLRK